MTKSHIVVAKSNPIAYHGSEDKLCVIFLLLLYQAVLSDHPGRRYTRKLAPITPATNKPVKSIPFLVILLLFLLRLSLCVNLICII